MRVVGLGPLGHRIGRCLACVIRVVRLGLLSSILVSNGCCLGISVWIPISVFDSRTSIPLPRLKQGI